MPAAATTRRKALRTFAGSSGVPVVVENIELLELASVFGALLLDKIAVLRQGFDAAGRQVECEA